MALLGLLLGLSAVVSAAPPELPPARPSPRPPAFEERGQKQESADDDDGGPDIHSDVWGTVTDLSTGRAGQGVTVVINGAVVRTDGAGRFSLTGLPAGEYVLRLELPAGATAARPQWTVRLDGRSAAMVELGYYSGPVPATPSATATAVALLPQTGAAGHMNWWLITGLVICCIGLSITLIARKENTQ